MFDVYGNSCEKGLDILAVVILSSPTSSVRSSVWGCVGMRLLKRLELNQEKLHFDAPPDRLFRRKGTYEAKFFPKRPMYTQKRELKAL